MREDNLFLRNHDIVNTVFIDVETFQEGDRTILRVTSGVGLQTSVRTRTGWCPKGPGSKPSRYTRTKSPTSLLTRGPTLPTGHSFISTSGLSLQIEVSVDRTLQHQLVQTVK